MEYFIDFFDFADVFFQFTDQIVSIYDGEYVEYTWNSFQIRKLGSGEKLEREPYQCKLDIEQAQKGEFPHYMLKEIHEQPEKAQAIINFLEESSQAREFALELKSESRVYLVGSSSSYNACVIGS
ncbi:unnamed protein product, partial [marine sediment metagenome]